LLFLFKKAMLLVRIPSDSVTHLAHCCVMNLAPYQLALELQALRRLRFQVLIAGE
jgi:hypothetical protein